MGVPTFMAYNGGATAATVDTIQKAPPYGMREVVMGEGNARNIRE